MHRFLVYPATRPSFPHKSDADLHQSLQNELLTEHGRFESIEALQDALDAWRQEYNTDRPHQSLKMAFPASRFGPATSALDLRVPARLGLSSPPELDHAPAADVVRAEPSLTAVETDRLVPPSGNLWIGGQQVWLGPAMAGRTVTIWVDESTLHVLLDGHRLKTLPSRLGVIELARLTAGGASPAGPPPLPAGPGTAIEIERMVNGVGLASLCAPCPAPVPAADRNGLRGARRARPMPPQPGGPITVQRRVSFRGSLMVARQKIHAGMIHAGKTATVICENTSRSSSAARLPSSCPAPPAARSTATKLTPASTRWPGPTRKGGDVSA